MRPSVSHGLASVFFVLHAALQHLAGQETAPSGVKLEIVSARVLSNSEAAARSPDFVGPNVGVRLRLSTLDRGLSFYSWKGSAVPAGYKVERSGQGTFWLYGNAGIGKQKTSPGLKAVLFGSVGEWITLPAHSAVEWEILDSTIFSGSQHAFTIFVRIDSAEDKEVISDFFEVPGK